MADSQLEAVLAAYLARPVTGDHLPATFSLTPALTSALQEVARARAVPVDVLVEFYLFKQLRNEHARMLVDEAPDPIPSSFINEQVARAKGEVAKDVAAIKDVPGRGDRAAAVTSQLEAMLKDVTGDAALESVQRRTAEHDAMIDLALNKQKK